VKLVLIAASICGVALWCLHDGPTRNAETAEAANEVFTTVVDWYRPYKQHGNEIQIKVPNEFIGSVPRSLRDEAALLLGDSEAIQVTKEQAAKFSSIGEPEVFIAARIDKLKEKVKFFEEHPVDDAESLKRYDKAEIEEQKERRQAIVDDLNSESTRLLEWKNELKPYLIKAVALQAGGSFGATFAFDDLVVYFVALGTRPVPMERCPVVAFLPRQPHKVYTAVEMIE